jgi:hypothetical protein
MTASSAKIEQKEASYPPRLTAPADAKPRGTLTVIANSDVDNLVDAASARAPAELLFDGTTGSVPAELPIDGDHRFGPGGPAALG